MKTLLIPIILLFASCSKIEEIVPEQRKDVMIEVQTKNASAVLVINNKEESISCLNNHCLNVYKVDSIQNLSILNTSLIGYLDMTITDYRTGKRYKTGNIKNFLKIK